MKAVMVLVTCLVLMAGSFGIAGAGEKHLFYMHGCCLGKVGESGYKKIIEALQEDGFNVHYDFSYDDSTDEVTSYAAKVAEQVKMLLSGGTPPEDITVSGYSLGSVKSMYAAMAIADPKVNYVLLAGCPGSGARSFDIDYTKIQGRVLAITDVNDDRFGSCGNRISSAVTFKEITIDSGEGHKGFRLGNRDVIELWKTPLVDWANGKQ